MDPRSEVLLRQRHLFATPLLLAGLPADDLLAELPQAQGWAARRRAGAVGRPLPRP